MKTINLPLFKDGRGTLTVWDNAVPFTPKRVFWIQGIPHGEQRAGHGHRECQQAIFAVRGSFMVNDRILANPSIGLYIPTNEIITLHSFSADAVCLVLASEHYDSSEIYELA